MTGENDGHLFSHKLLFTTQNDKYKNEIQSPDNLFNHYESL